jgi:hypothetical protein
VRLEGLLRDALLYTTWALTNDHFTSIRPFVYQQDVHEASAIKALEQASLAGASTDSRNRVTFDDRLTIYPLTRGFQILAEMLSTFEASADEHLRPQNDIPSWSYRQELQAFPFSHIVPFLDLMPESRELIIKQLREVSRRLVSADVNEARNDWSHARRSPVDIDRLRASLEAVREAVLLIQDGGYCRQVYRRVRSESDEASRTTIVVKDAREQEIVFFRPSRFAWLGFPPLTVSQHMMLSARLAEPTEVLRFVSEIASPYSKMWQDYPVRMARSASSLTVRESSAPPAA